jgi:hypothetical protein
MNVVRGASLWIAVICLLAACAGASSEVRPAVKAAISAVASPHAKPTSDREVAALTLLATHEAAGNGDPNVRSARYVETTRDAALRLLNAGQAVGPSAQSRVTLVVMTGHFTAYGASIPYGGTVPTGTVLSFTYDASIGHVVDFGLDSSPVDLSWLGPVGTLHLG